MIESVIRWSIQNRVLVLIGTGFLVIAGVISALNTPVDAIPDLSDVQVIVKTSYPGQAPRVVEDQVTYPLSTALIAVPKTTDVRGYSFFGDSYIYVLFEDGTDIYWARSRVLEYLNQAASDLPTGVSPMLGPDATGVGWVYEYALVDRTGKLDLAQLRTLQDWFLKFELQTVPGVAEVATVGGMVKQYQVVADPDRLHAFGLTVGDIRNAIQTNNQESGGSVIEMGEAEYMVRSTGYIQSIEDLGQVPLKVNQQGTPLQLSDVAEVRLGPKMRRGIAELDGEGEVVGGIVVQRAGENALEVIDRVKKRLEAIQGSLPDGVEVVTTYDRSKLIRRAVENLEITLVEEFMVVALICTLFLFHFRSSLVIIVSLPVGILGAFVIMRMQGISANIMSLGGIAIAVGAMVDAAIVMVENAHKQLQAAGENVWRQNPALRWQIVSDAATELGRPIFISLLIVTLSFLPVFTLEAQEGRLFTPLAYTKTYAMAFAAALAITLVPVLMGLFIRGRIRNERANPVNRMLIRGYRPIIRAVVKHPVIAIISCVSVLSVGIIPITKLGSEFMPPLDEGDLMYMPSTYPAMSIDKARELLQQTDKLIRTHPEVETVFGKVGRAETATDPAPLTMLETMIQLKPTEQWRAGVTMDSIRDELNRLVDFPGLNNSWVMPIKTRIDMLATGIKTPVGIKILGPDLSVIASLGEQIERVLSKVDGTLSVYAERVTGGRYIEIRIKRDRIARYGLDINDVQEVIRTAVGGMDVGQTVEGLDRYPINIRYPQRVRDSLERLELLPIVTPSDARIALIDVAEIKLTDGPPVIKSENARPTGWLFVDISDRDLGSYVAEAIDTIGREVSLPIGYSLHWSGQYEYLMRAQQRLAIMGPLTLAIVLLLLYLNFRRFREAALLIGTMPLSLGGGITLLYLLDYDLSVAVGVGFIALAGVTVELGVVMLTYLENAAERAIQNKINKDARITFSELAEAIIDGASMRLRPIFMTTVTVVIGLLPIMLGTGTGSEVMRRIATPMVGGMISATLLTLILIPAVFLLWQKRQLTLQGEATAEA